MTETKRERVPAMVEYRRIREAEGVNAAFEWIAHEFYVETGVMAPGKDDPLGSHTHEHRATLFRDWCKANDTP